MSPTKAVKTLVIDGQDVSGVEDETILQVARDHDIFIPTLCELDGLSPHGGCRLCLVEVQGFRKLTPACVTRIEEGMVVHTDTEQLREYRRAILELMFSERNHICAVCVSNGHCDLQAMAQRLGVDHVRYNYLDPRLSVDASHPLFEADHNRCILCTRCVRVCDEIEGAHTWDLRNRGIKTLITSDYNMPWGESDSCTSCGKCVNVCPTGALFERGKSVAEMAKRRQFLPYLVLMREVER